MAVKSQRVDKQAGKLGRKYASGTYAARVKNGWCARCAVKVEIEGRSYCNRCTTANREASERYHARKKREGAGKAGQGALVGPSSPIVQPSVLPADLQCDYPSAEAAHAAWKAATANQPNNGLSTQPGPRFASIAPNEVPVSRPASYNQGAEVAINELVPPVNPKAEITVAKQPWNSDFGNPIPITDQHSNTVNEAHLPPVYSTPFADLVPEVNRGVQAALDTVNKVGQATLEGILNEREAHRTATLQQYQPQFKAYGGAQMDRGVPVPAPKPAPVPSGLAPTTRTTQPVKSLLKQANDAAVIREHLSNLRALYTDLARLADQASVLKVAVNKMVVRIAGVVE